jgi:hypothetical protein
MLREVARALMQPGYIIQEDFDRKIEDPNWFTSNMLTMVLFKKHVLNVKG